MINAIIFSYNRPIQLHLLLETISINAKDIFNISVIYKHSNDNFKKGYEILKTKFDNISWIDETFFKEQTLSLLNSNLEYTCFFTDDDILFGNILENDIIECLKNDDVFCFSTRIGKNTTYCYSLNCDDILTIEKEDDKFVWWNWTKHKANNGYPLSVDGHIFRTKEINKFVKKISFHNPNTLEGSLQIFNNFPKDIMVAYKYSVLVNSPNNVVSDTHSNRMGEKYKFTPKELNDKYLDGYIIDYNAIDFSNIVGAHQEIDFKLKKN